MPFPWNHYFVRKALVITFALGFGQAASLHSQPVHAAATKANPDAKERQFVDALLEKMTLEEKLWQMSQISYKDTDPSFAMGWFARDRLDPSSSSPIP